jgi:glutamyl-tRNA reductase
LEKKHSKVFAFGLNHQTAPIDVRERFAFDAESVVRELSELQVRALVEEALILSTCNRTEIYFCAPHPDPLVSFISEKGGIDRCSVDTYSYLYVDQKALEHATRVASGLDSMVLGETQILGQLKDAHRNARMAGLLGPNLNKFFDVTFSIAKEIRSKTAVGQSSVSLAGATLKVLRTIFPEGSQQRVLFVGAGEMIRLCAQHLSNAFPGRMDFVNRSIDKADYLAKKYSGRSFALSLLPEILRFYDVLVTCTGSQVPILGKGAIEQALRLRKHSPIVAFDLAVPRDVEQIAGELDDLFLYSVDDLGAMVQQGVESREAAATEAEQIVKGRSREFVDWQSSRMSADIVKTFRQFGGELAQQELKKALEALKRSDDPEEVLHSLTNALTKKFLDRPSRALNSARGDDRKKLSDTISKLFNLDDPI